MKQGRAVRGSRWPIEGGGSLEKPAGLVFVGLDVIGERLTEVNVTSPTGIQQLGQFSGSFPEDRVIDWIERQRLH